MYLHVLRMMVVPGQGLTRTSCGYVFKNLKITKFSWVSDHFIRSFRVFLSISCHGNIGLKMRKFVFYLERRVFE